MRKDILVETFALEDFPGEIWLTADWHCGHQSLLDKPDSHRPWTNIDKHDNALFKNAKELVKPNDLLIMVGDLALAGPTRASFVERCISKMPTCTKVLVYGNHDRLAPKMYLDFGFSVAATCLVLPGGILVTHDPADATVWPKDKPVVCAHVHDLFKVIDNVVNVGVDVWGFEPVKMDDALGLCTTERAPRDWNELSRERHSR